MRVGLVPGDGDTYFLPRLVGAAKALELLWTADFIEAPEAHRLGIVQRVVPDAQLKDATYAMARQIADGPQIPIRMIKRLVYQSLKLDLRTHLDLVSSHMSIVRQTADHKEGVAAFKEKRPPRFEGADWRASALPQLRVERVPERIAEEVEAEHAEADRDAREQRDPRRLLGVRRGGAREHQAPRRRRLRRAEPQVRQGRLGQDRGAELARSA